MLESGIFHEFSTWFLWEFLPINEHPKLCFCQIFEPMFFLRFKCSFTGRIFQKKLSQNFMKILWLNHVIFFKKLHFSNIRFSEMSIFHTFLSSRLRKNLGTIWCKNVYPHSGREGDRRRVLHFYIPQDGNLRSHFWHGWKIHLQNPYIPRTGNHRRFSDMGE